MSALDVFIIGGGPAGATAAIALAENGLRVALAEKKAFPRETLCGEFISPEAQQILFHYGLKEAFFSLKPNPITRLGIYSPDMKIQSPLGFTGYGLKRGALDELLMVRAAAAGTEIFQPAEVTALKQIEGAYDISLRYEGALLHVKAVNVIAAWGRQNPLDRSTGRILKSQRYVYNAVKYHLPAELLKSSRSDEIGLFMCDDIYCGINHVNDNDAAICFIERHRAQEDISVKDRLKELGEKNSQFREILPGIDDVLCRKAYGTGNIYFGKREIIKDGMFIIGDSARVIAPLAGDGISMAVRSGRMAAEAICAWVNDTRKHSSLYYENQYKKQWAKMFTRRVRAARLVQSVVFNERMLDTGLKTLNRFPYLLETLIRITR